MKFNNRLFERDKNGLWSVVKYLIVVLAVVLFMAFVQSLYLVNFDKAVRNCVKNQGLSLVRCKDLAK